MPSRSFKLLVSFLPLSRWLSSVLRLSSVLYGSGTDAGWVRLYDAAAPAAISSAANPNNHTAKSRNDTTGSPLDSEHPALITTHGPRRRNREERAFARGLLVARSAFLLHLLLMRLLFPSALGRGLTLPRKPALTPGPSVVPEPLFSGQTAAL